ncbi:hypothetical protein HanIR_Chr05g0248721 [Helianthus annuus]|nr:hypothetical protein HanIR_Chr05g0248721 [Helianthus annuus]
MEFRDTKAFTSLPHPHFYNYTKNYYIFSLFFQLIILFIPLSLSFLSLSLTNTFKKYKKFNFSIK